MSDSKDDKITFNTSDVINALLHQRQSQQHLATQESVESLRRETATNFTAVEKRIEQVESTVKELKQDTNKRFDKLERKFYRLQWFIVAAALVIIFKDNLFHLFGAVHL